MPGRRLHRRTPEKAVVLDALLPEVLALVPALEEELHRVLVITLERPTLKTRTNARSRLT